MYTLPPLLNYKGDDFRAPEDFARAAPRALPNVQNNAPLASENLTALPALLNLESFTALAPKNTTTTALPHHLDPKSYAAQTPEDLTATVPPRRRNLRSTAFVGTAPGTSASRATGTARTAWTLPTARATTTRRTT